MTDRERIARAMSDDWHGRMERWSSTTSTPYRRPDFEKERHVWEGNVDAALDAMLEPSEGALNAGAAVCFEDHERLRETWQAMIRYMREEKDG